MEAWTKRNVTIDILRCGSWALPYSVRFRFGLGCLSLGGWNGQCGHTSPFFALHLSFRLPLLQFDSDGPNARRAVKKFEFRGLAVSIDRAECSATNATSAISSGEPTCFQDQGLKQARPNLHVFPLCYDSGHGIPVFASRVVACHIPFSDWPCPVYVDAGCE
jgi:hypothetical protein